MARLGEAPEGHSGDEQGALLASATAPPCSPLGARPLHPAGAAPPPSRRCLSLAAAGGAAALLLAAAAVAAAAAAWRGGRLRGLQRGGWGSGSVERETVEEAAAPQPWQCHRYVAQRNEAWCKRVGSEAGFEYKFFGRHSPCGVCWCCKRGFGAPPVPTVTLPSGAKVLGDLLAPWGQPAEDSVHAYFGIRFATAGRFEAPELYTAPATEVIDGSVLNEQCMQGPSGWGVEDCLTLAVLSPSGPAKPKRSVVVWIHGGNLVSGAIKNEAGKGKLNHLVQQGDVVVVAIQYRLGAFGFFQPPGDHGAGAAATTPANRGLRDQVEALKWVQKNIASFGGDPRSVTIMGQSAGARSVMALYHSPLTVDLFHRAIAQSPGLQSTMFIEPTSKSAETMGQRCLEASGCKSLDCLRRMDGRRLARNCRFYSNTQEFVDVPGMYFAGYDGEVLADSMSATLCRKATAPNTDKPILVGSMAHEWRTFQGLPPQRMAHRFLWEYMQGYAESEVEVQRCSIELMLEGPYASAECHLRPERCAAYGRPALMQLATDGYSLGLGFAMGQGAGQLYHYILDIEAAGGNCGSCHCGDLSIIFGESNPQFSSGAFRTSNSRWDGLQPMLIEYLASFAKTGSPASISGPAWLPASRDPSVTWGLPVMSFNLSSGTSMRSSAWLNNHTQDAMTKLLCGRASIPPRCLRSAHRAVVKQ